MFYFSIIQYAMNIICFLYCKLSKKAPITKNVDVYKQMMPFNLKRHNIGNI